MSEVNEMTGKIVHIGELQEFASGFCKKVVVIEAVDGSYTNQYGFELLKDKCDLANSLSVGEEVCVKFNLGRCREYNRKWYGDMHTAWNIKPTGQAQPAPANDAASDADDLPMGDFDSESDVPF